MLLFYWIAIIPMDYDQYTTWSENVRLVRMEYLNGKLTAEEFLRRIDTTHELSSYETDKAELVEETVWQHMVAGNLNFDAETRYPETMQVLDLGAEEPGRELRTADELRREDQKGRQSLREKYGKRQKAQGLKMMSLLLFSVAQILEYGDMSNV